MPPELEQIVRESDEALCGNIEECVAEVIARWNEEVDPSVRESYYLSFTQEAIRSRVHSRRHAVNRKMRKAAGMYGNTVGIGTSELLAQTCDQAHQSLMQTWRIGGTVIGKLNGAQLAYYGHKRYKDVQTALLDHIVLIKCSEVVLIDQYLEDVLTDEEFNTIVDEAKLEMLEMLEVA